jgi:hypothetical protein
VKNNFQKRTNGTISTGVGLKNLRERYSFLSGNEPSFYQEGDYFYAKVPLLKQG